MSDLFFDTIRRLDPVLRRGDFEACEAEVAGELRKLRPTPFHIVLDLSISNDPADAARHFDRFFQSAAFQIRAAYTEMNGFDINPNRWYCDLFAYRSDGGQDDYDWLSGWDSDRFEEYEIRGLERLQQAYASKAFKAVENREASYMSSLLVVVKFQRFMHAATAHMEALQFPLYVTAHDYDFIAAVGPYRPAIVAKPSVDEATAEAIRNLRDESPRTRFRAVMSLYMIGPGAAAAVPALIEHLRDTDSPTCQAAARALSQIAPTSEQVVSALIDVMNRDQNVWVRREIARALGYSPTKKAVAALAVALADSDRDMRYNSAISLKLLGRNAIEAAPALRKLMETETDKATRLQASTALEVMGEFTSDR